MIVSRVCIGVGLAIGVASAQSVYVDFDIGSGSAGIGSGAPSSSFGGAAGVPGIWNRQVDQSVGPDPLLDTDGSNTGVALSSRGIAGGFGYANSSNTGDYAALLNDAWEVGNGGLTLTVSGLRSGEYRVFTYAVEPQGNPWTTEITVPGSTEGTLSVTGPMPGNELIDGITHSTHDINVDGGSLIIYAGLNWPNSYVNGLQILSVPEPSTISVFGVSLAALATRRRRARM